MAKKDPLIAEALRSMTAGLEAKRRLWQGRRARGRKGSEGTEPPGFGKRTFPLAPPLPPGYAKGGGGVAGVPDFLLLEGENLEPSLTNAERRWLTDHDMPALTTNRVVVLRRVQQWDAEIAKILSKLQRTAPPELSSVGQERQPALWSARAQSHSTALLQEKARSRKRTP